MTEAYAGKADSFPAWVTRPTDDDSPSGALFWRSVRAAGGQSFSLARPDRDDRAGRPDLQEIVIVVEAEYAVWVRVLTVGPGGPGGSGDVAGGGGAVAPAVSFPRSSPRRCSTARASPSQSHPPKRYSQRAQTRSQSPAAKQAIARVADRVARVVARPLPATCAVQSAEAPGARVTWARTVRVEALQPRAVRVARTPLRTRAAAGSDLARAVVVVARV